MAEKNEELDLDISDGEGVKKSPKKLILIIVGVILLIAISIGATLFLVGFFDDNTDPENDDKAKDETSETSTISGENEADSEQDDVGAKPHYHTLEPAFVLNFEGKSPARYMQIAIALMSKQEATLAELEKHAPVIRNRILLLLSNQKYVELITPEGKKKLKLEIKETVEKVIQKKSKKLHINAVYFTSFIMQ